MYLIGTAVAIAVVLGLARFARGWGLRAPLVLSVVRILVALGAGALSLWIFLDALRSKAAGDGVPGSAWLALATLALLTLSAAIAQRGVGPASEREGIEDSSGDRQPLPSRPRFSPLDLVIPALVGILIYVSSWKSVTGRLFLEDNLLHWDYFAMGPALAFRHGLSLGGDISPNYGVGWPVLFSSLSDLVPLSYGRMIQIGSIYVCIYLVGIYLLLRLAIGRPAVAAAGTGLALLPFFFWTNGLFLWLAPAVTPMRTPFDVWCFVALLLYGRSGRRGWAVLAGALAGLELLFSLQAGFVLGAALLFWWIGSAAISDDRRRSVIDFAGSLTALVGVALGGFLIAGRGDVAWASFLDEPLDFLTVQLTASPPRTVLAFALLVSFYLGAIGHAAGRLFGRRGDQLDLLVAFVAFYGLLLLSKFVHYSTNTILPRLVTPAAIVLTILVGRKLFPRPAGSNGWRRRGLPLAAGLLLLALTAALFGRTVKNAVTSYPNVLARAGEDAGTVCLLREPADICGLPAGMGATVSGFEEVLRPLRALKNNGETFAVIDETGSLFYQATETAGFGISSRTFVSAYTRDLVGRFVSFYAADPPDAVLTRRPLEPESADFATWAAFGVGPRPDSPYADTWDALLAVVHERYRLDQVLGPFELWRLKPAEAGG